MTETGWLAVAIAVGAVLAGVWIARELWIHARRRRRRDD